MSARDHMDAAQASELVERDPRLPAIGDEAEDTGPPWLETALTAEAFHEAYERLAPEFGYNTRAESALPWAEVPESNRLLMEAVVAEMRERIYKALDGIVTVGHPLGRPSEAR